MGSLKVGTRSFLLLSEEVQRNEGWEIGGVWTRGTFACDFARATK